MIYSSTKQYVHAYLYKYICIFPMFTYDSTVYRSYVNIGNSFLLWSTDLYTRSYQNLIVHKPNNHVHSTLEKKFSSHLAIVAGPSVLLFSTYLFPSATADWKLWTRLTCLPILFCRKPYLELLSSHKLIEYGCFRSVKVFLLVRELALHERFVKLCVLDIIFRYICCDNWKCDAALLFLTESLSRLESEGQTMIS
jgi:hypothetical protein